MKCLFRSCALSMLLLTACSVPDTGPGAVETLREGAADRAGPGDPTDIRVRTLLQWLQEPWGMDFLPDGRLLLTEKSGTLKLVNLATVATTDVAGVPASINQGQGGLMDVHVHPDFEDNGWIYLSYSVELQGGYTTRVSRMRLQGDALVDQQDLFTALPAFSQRRHFGSRLLLDAGYLYITVGDRGNRDLAQSLSTHNGKVMRLHDDGRIPADNPFAGRAGARPEIYTYGHRNPQGIARHPHNGQVWISEHGPKGGDEINVLLAGSNYGWPVVTYGREYGGEAIGEGTHREGMQPPLIYYMTSIGSAGIDFYTADTYPGWSDSLLVSGLRLTRLNRLELAGDGLGAETRLLGDLGMRIRDVQVGPDGLVYVLADRSRLVRLEPQ